LTALAPVLALACASSTPVRQSTASASPTALAGPVSDIAATLVVDQFLRAANANDLDAMARIFGNRMGPIAEQSNANDLDRRMFVLASALRHDSYSIVRSEIVPGRRSEAMKIIVNMHIRQRSVDVPFTVVKAKGDRMLVEDFDLVKILSGN
jgi:hypothetical protein